MRKVVASLFLSLAGGAEQPDELVTERLLLTAPVSKTPRRRT